MFDNNNYNYASYSCHKTPLSSKIKQRIYTLNSSRALSKELLCLEPDTKSEYNNRRSSNISYKILTYDKFFFCMNEPLENCQYRSVIFSHPENKILSFSPPKSILSDVFLKKYPLDNNRYDDLIYANEMIEGTLIHLFYDTRIQSWEIATKNAVGGQYVLFRNGLYSKDTHNYKIKHKPNPRMPTVYRMVLDALRAPPSTYLNDIPLLANFNKQNSYSMVLQHPANHIILPIEFPALYLVAVYDLYTPLQNYMRAVSIPPTVFQEWDCFKNTPILFPPVVDIYKHGYQRLDNYKTMGIMIINTQTGDRCSIRNEAYQDVLRVRETDTCHQYQYLCLKRINRIDDYLRFFPTQKKRFSLFYKQYNDFVENVHTAYMEQYIWSKMKDTNININIRVVSPKYWPYVQRLHKEIYLPSLSKGSSRRSLTITRTITHEFMRNMDPAELLYCLNYEGREYFTDKKHL